MTENLPEVRAEFLLPHEVAAALAAQPVVYLPLGSIEFHSAHLPIGLDGLTAAGVCREAAGRAGGVVLPTLYYGVGGSHTSYPWTIMADTDVPLRALLAASFSRLADFGVRVAVLFTGHFAPEQLTLIREVADGWNDAGTGLRVVALSVSDSGAGIAPDHAGVFETSLLSALWPERVQLERLPPLVQVPAGDPGGDVTGAHRHDPGHPLYGVFGPDPRTFDPARTTELLDEIVSWTIAQVDRESEARR